MDKLSEGGSNKSESLLDSTNPSNNLELAMDLRRGIVKKLVIGTIVGDSYNMIQDLKVAAYQR